MYKFILLVSNFREFGFNYEFPFSEDRSKEGKLQNIIVGMVISTSVDLLCLNDISELIYFISHSNVSSDLNHVTFVGCYLICA